MTIPALLISVLLANTPPSLASTTGTAPPVNSEAKKAAPQTAQKTIVFIGDSLTQGYGVQEEEAYPNLVGQKLLARGYRVTIINGGISGSTTADADRRLKWYLRSNPKIVVLALGANDGLRGTAADTIKKNLAAVIDLANQKGISVLLCGMQIFSNFGAGYSKSFVEVYTSLAKEKKVRLMPFLLAGVALHKELMQSDGKHPNAKGHAIIAENVTKELVPLLNQVSP